MNNIIEKLKSGKIEMRPKWHFALRSILLILLTILTLILILFLASFLLFHLKRSGIFFGPLPFVMFLLMIVFVALVEFLINRYAVAYRKPVVYSLLIVVALMVAMGLAINKVHFHEKIEKRNLPMIKRFYDAPKKDPIRRDIEINKRRRM